MPSRALLTRGDSEPTRLSSTCAHPWMPLRGERRSCAAAATSAFRALVASSRWMRSTSSEKESLPPGANASGTCGTGFFLFVVDDVVGAGLVRGTVLFQPVV